MARKLIAFVFLALATVRCAPEPSPNSSSTDQDDRTLLPIIVLTLDTTRADHLGFYGYPRDVSPHLDRIADESLVFDRAITPMATTLPAHTSLFTGTYPLEHGVLANVKHGGSPFPVGGGLRTAAEFAQQAGYATGAAISAAPLKRSTNISAGFDFFDEPEGRERDAMATVDAALAWLEHTRRLPFFLWLHFFDPHYPLTPRSPAAGTFSGRTDLRDYLDRRGFPQQCLHRNGRLIDTIEAVNLYDEEILFMDSAIGRLRAQLETWDLWDRAIVIVVGDHGEGLCQHDQRDHGYVYHEQLRIPLLLKYPGEAPRRIAAVTSIIDVFPTVFSKMGNVHWQAFLEQAGGGRDQTAADASSRHVFSQRTERARDDLPPVSYALTGERWKLILEPHGGTRLFDLDSDPYEMNDLLAKRPEIARELSDETTRLLEHFESRRAKFFSTGSRAGQEQEVDEQRLEELRSLGYVD